MKKNSNVSGSLTSSRDVERRLRDVWEMLSMIVNDHQDVVKVLSMSLGLVNELERRWEMFERRLRDVVNDRQRSSRCCQDVVNVSRACTIYYITGFQNYILLHYRFSEWQFITLPVFRITIYYITGFQNYNLLHYWFSELQFITLPVFRITIYYIIGF